MGYVVTQHALRHRREAPAIGSSEIRIATEFEFLVGLEDDLEAARQRPE